MQKICHKFVIFYHFAHGRNPSRSVRPRIRRPRCSLPHPPPRLLRAHVYIIRCDVSPRGSPESPPRALPPARFSLSLSLFRLSYRPNFILFVMISEILSLFPKFSPQKVCGMGNYSYLCIRFREDFPSAALRGRSLKGTYIQNRE